MAPHTRFLTVPYQRTKRMIISRSKWRPLKSSSMLSTRQLYRSNNQPTSYAALTQFAPEPPEAARRLSGRRPVRRLRRLQDNRRQDTRRPDHARLLLVAPATSVLRSRQGRSADRPRGAGADRRALRDREDDPRHGRRGASSRAPGEEQAARHGVQTVARTSVGARFRQVRPRRGSALWPEPLERARPLPR